ncbi:DegT/DnrJ/EryC1/StrS family aminotransferase [Candidatus Pacearchaeota archaeon]|nr:DegT/DnrJ/EryC1/StrS family aminotransferase [Candidatus Pacearchaeota archaeon]MBI2057065.1 DegT/DnrJ/EryC1/StrS family aminotransferase [Candidatus Pacearchaeota archaeon]
MIWKVPYINLGKQFKNLEKELIVEFKRVMSEGSFILRQDVKRFEENLANYLGVREVIGVNSGTDALYLAIEAIGINKKDEIITVAHSFVAPISAIIRRGAKPIFVDIQNDFNMDVSQVEKKITNKTKAILPVHLNGRCCDMAPLNELSKKYNLPIIEDAAQAIGAKYNKKRAGSFGLAGCFSLHPMKTLSCAGDGGAISTNDVYLAEKLRVLRDHGQKIKGEFLGVGYNSRLDNLQAAILNVKFKHLDEYIKKRRKIAEIYNEELSSLPIILPPAPSKEKYFDTYTSYVIRTDKQEKLIKFLRENGIEVFVHVIKPLDKHQGLGLEQIVLPKNELICSQNVSIPIYPEMEKRQIKEVIDNLKKFYK